MPTIIDSLKVVLGLDTSEFDAGKKKVDSGLDETGKKGDKAGEKLNKTGGSFAKVATNAAKFLAVIGGTVAIKRFMENQIEANAALDRLSHNLNTNVESISAWSNATEQAGGSAEGLQGTFDMLSKSQTELMLTGQSALIPYFSSLGVSMATATGKARPLDDILLDLASKFQKLDRPTANNMGRMMGIDQGTMQLLLKGRTEVELMIRRQKEFGVVSAKQAEEASRLKRSITDSKQAFSAFGRELMSAAMPAIENILRVLANVGTWMRENKEFVSTFLTILAAGLAGLAAAITPINMTAAAIVALAGGIALLWQDYQTFKRGGDSLIDWSKWEPGIMAATKAISFLRNLLEDVMYRAIAAADAMVAMRVGDWSRFKMAVGEFKAGNGKPYVEPEKPAAKPTQRPVAPTTPEPVPAIPRKGEKLTAPPDGSPSAASTDTKDSDKKAMGYFQQQGWTPQQAAGIIASIKRESNFNPAAVGDGGKAYGLAQWHPDRQADFEKRYKKPMQGSSVDDQLAFIQYELTLGREKEAGNKLRKSTNEAEAAGVVSTHYERPADMMGEAIKRANIAKQLIVDNMPATQATPATPATDATKATPATPATAATEATPATQATPATPATDATKATPATPATAATEATPATQATPATPVTINVEPVRVPAPAPIQYLPQVQSMMQGVPGAGAAAAGAGAAPTAARNAPVPSAAPNVSKSVETHIGAINLTLPNATDANSVAKGLGQSMDYLFTSQANYGLT